MVFRTFFLCSKNIFDFFLSQFNVVIPIIQNNQHFFLTFCRSLKHGYPHGWVSWNWSPLERKVRSQLGKAFLIRENILYGCWCEYFWRMGCFIQKYLSVFPCYCDLWASFFYGWSLPLMLPPKTKTPTSIHNSCLKHQSAYSCS